VFAANLIDEKPGKNVSAAKDGYQDRSPNGLIIPTGL
jgi:hypothetical protein